MNGKPDPRGEPITLALCADGNVIASLHVCLLTALEAATAGTRFDIHLITPAKLPRREVDALRATLDLAGRPYALHHVPTDVAQLQGLRGLHGERAAHLKWLLPELLPSVPRFIVLDTDLVVRVDLGELWSISLGDCPVAAVPIGTVEYSCDTRFLSSLGAPLDMPYYNTGVMLVSTVAWSDAGLTETFRRFAREHAPQLRAADQTIYNAVLAPSGRIVALDAKFNDPLFPDAPGRALDEPHVYHLLGTPKPWDPFGRLLNNHSAAFYGELARTAYRPDSASGRSPLRWATRAVRLSRAYAVGLRTRLRSLRGAPGAAS